MPGMLRSAPRRGRPEARREAGSASGSRAPQSVRGLVELARAAPAGGGPRGGTGALSVKVCGCHVGWSRPGETRLSEGRDVDSEKLSRVQSRREEAPPCASR